MCACTSTCAEADIFFGVYQYDIYVCRHKYFYVHVYMGIKTHVFKCMYLNLCLYVCMYVCKYAFMSVSIYVCMFFLQVCKYVSM